MESGIYVDFNRCERDKLYEFAGIDLVDDGYWDFGFGDDAGDDELVDEQDKKDEDQKVTEVYLRKNGEDHANADGSAAKKICENLNWCEDKIFKEKMDDVESVGADGRGKEHDELKMLIQTQG